MEQVENKQSKAGKKKEPDFLKQYRECYPENKTFYVTTDKMVFLVRDENLAADHQRSIGKGQVSTY